MTSEERVRSASGRERRAPVGVRVRGGYGDRAGRSRETRAERQCVVGWFHEYREERVPNLDAMLQHSEAG